jgi:hypothetical protein
LYSIPELNGVRPILVLMVADNHPSSARDCVALLQSVLRCLDKISHERHAGSDGEQVSLAAAHVQQAIELIQPLDQLDS